MPSTTIEAIRAGGKLFDILQVPAEQWPGERVYCFCPSCRNIVAILKGDPANCPQCSRKGLKDIFSEIMERLERAWGFYESTRFREGAWLFKHSPDSPNYSLWSTAVMGLATYGELRAFGLPEPWGSDEEILKAWTDDINRHIDPETKLLQGPVGDEAPHGSIVSMERYISSGYTNALNRLRETGVWPPGLKDYQIDAGQMTDEDHLRSKEAFLQYQEREKEHWRKNPWGAGSWTGRVIMNHREILKSQGMDPDDEVVDFAHHWLDQHQNPRTGAWGGEEAPHHRIVNGIFKVLVTYEQLNWSIHYQDQIVDFVLSDADPVKGFTGVGCSVFDPMMVLLVIRERGCDYRARDVEEKTAATFLTFLENWDEQAGWYRGDTWNGKHNNGIPAYMARLLLDR